MITNAHLYLEGWSGRTKVAVEILSETRTKYRVRLNEAAVLPGYRSKQAGDVVLVPKTAVKRMDTQP